MIKKTYNTILQYIDGYSSLRVVTKSFPLFTLMISLIMPSLFLFGPSVEYAYAQSNNNWFVGKGAQENTYYTYKIQHHDVNQGRPFLMTIYFKDFNDEGQYWIAPVFVVDQGRVINGTFHLSALDMSALGSSDIPSEMTRYRGGYIYLFEWLS